MNLNCLDYAESVFIDLNRPDLNQLEEGWGSRRDYLKHQPQTNNRARG